MEHRYGVWILSMGMEYRYGDVNIKCQMDQLPWV